MPGSNSLAGKTALVTGASQSIGLTSALELARDGATVVIIGRGEHGLRAARGAMRSAVPGGRIEMVVGDAFDEKQLQAALSFAHGLQGRHHILVPTVGGGVLQPILMRDVDSVRQELEVNYVSVFLMIRHGVPLLSRGGTIVCISTVAVNQPYFGLGMYGATKAAVERLVRAAALELGGAGIRVNAVRPGMTVAKEVLDDPAQAANFQAYADETPLGRVGVPEDIAGVVRFLAGPESGWVTGQSFSVDGGQEQGKMPDSMDAVFGKAVMDAVRAGQPAPPGSQFAPMVSTSLSPTKN
jgi:NAD(P)-dependent dehydrogenase (short-subunit alcohol dehydrogenase family)